MYVKSVVTFKSHESVIKPFLTCDWQLSSPPDHKVPEQQLARVIPIVIFSHFLDGQSVPPPHYGLPPLLWLAFLDLNKQKTTNML